jgi:type I restriction enzyme S subunit
MSNLYQLPNGWEWKKLDDFVSIKGGKRVPKGKKLSDKKTNYPYIRVSDFNDFGSIDLDLIQYITEDIYNEIKNYIISKNDIYISIAGTIGKTGIVPNELDGANLTENAAKLVFDNAKYDKNYLLYFTNSIPFLEQVGLATKTVAMPKLALTRLKEVFIPLPPLSEQKRIVSKLDLLFEKIDKSIALHQKNMDEADVFMGSVLNDVFGELEEKYKFYRVNDKFDLKTGGTPSTKNKEYWDNGTIKWLSSSDINQIEISDCKGRITELGFNSSNTKIIEKDSVLIALNGQGKTRGSVAMLRTEATLNQSLVAMIPKDRNNNLSDFLFRNLQMRYIEIREMTGLNERRGLNMKLIGNIELPLPPLSIQQKTVKYLDEISQKIERVKSVQKEKMVSLKALKASILDRAFRGEL